ncbi:hypothetical protein AAHZ94_34375, partial [Streptomyces sp. HSW2009]
ARASRLAPDVLARATAVRTCATAVLAPATGLLTRAGARVAERAPPRGLLARGALRTRLARSWLAVTWLAVPRLLVGERAPRPPLPRAGGKLLARLALRYRKLLPGRRRELLPGPGPAPSHGRLPVRTGLAGLPMLTGLVVLPVLAGLPVLGGLDLVRTDSPGRRLLRGLTGGWPRGDDLGPRLRDPGAPGRAVGAGRLPAATLHTARHPTRHPTGGAGRRVPALRGQRRDRTEALRLLRLRLLVGRGRRQRERGAPGRYLVCLLLRPGLLAALLLARRPAGNLLTAAVLRHTLLRYGPFRRLGQGPPGPAPPGALGGLDLVRAGRGRRGRCRIHISGPPRRAPIGGGGGGGEKNRGGGGGGGGGG